MIQLVGTEFLLFSKFSWDANAAAGFPNLTFSAKDLKQRYSKYYINMASKLPIVTEKLTTLILKLMLNFDLAGMPTCGVLC